MLQRLVRLSAFALLSLLLLGAGQSRAYAPETGVWWNPAESGTGLILDLQDNFLAVSVFVGDTAGNPVWYTATGFLTGNARFDGTLDYFPGAQCIGCPYRPTNPQIGVGGPIRIDFNPQDPARATLTLGGRVTQIERFRFYYKRPEDEQRLPGVSADLTRLMGEWSLTLDFSDASGQGDGSYFGDVLIFDFLDADQYGDFVDGCRPADSLSGFCSDTDLDLRYALGEYVAAEDTHVIVVENSPTTYASYYLALGSEVFSGEGAVYTRGTNPSGFVPLRGFRSASRTFVEEGTGPSVKSQRKAGPGLPLTAGAAQSKRAAAQGALDAARQRLEAQLAARRAAQ
ncbi:MAG: hypothetical protein WCZ65_00545 [Lysobacteraceae bacterium]